MRYAFRIAMRYYRVFLCVLQYILTHCLVRDSKPYQARPSKAYPVP